MMKISYKQLEYLVGLLKWLSRDTLDADRELTESRYLETARLILDQLSMDYNDAERRWKNKQQ
jgi:hypothetical protein